MTDNDFKIKLNFGGGSVEAVVLTSWRGENTISTFEIIIGGKRIAQLEMQDLHWITMYGNLDYETVQYIGSQIDWHYENPK
ncbi:hypothetical protein ABIB40_000009 [Pedobacter sp. UYP30]|uniref:hypothetical protein n=1 Tax=Pedobacter sp. UYP30 TaxID=1756400 RepID=UPI00339B4B98